MYARSVNRDSGKPALPSTAPARFVQTCQLPGCGAGIPRRHLMCPQHWFEVPVELRGEVELSLAAWLGGKDDVRPYLRARLKALIHVAKLHQIDARNFEAQLVRWMPAEECHQ
jgi:hypothetical protein